MLERFRQAKQRELAALRAAADAGLLPCPTLSHPRADFKTALATACARMPVAIIAEYKRASPSRGIICETLAVEEVACQYAASGANALSILTEEEWFHGRMEFLDRAAAALPKTRPLPILRKDFIFDPLQILATANTAASALLLIARLTPSVRQLRQLREEAESAGLQAVVEVFDATDLRLARESGATIIQVNARNLGTLRVDRKACLALAEATPPGNGEIWVAASGMSGPEHLFQAADAGYSAVLLGTALMANGQPGAALQALVAGCHHPENRKCS